LAKSSDHAKEIYDFWVEFEFFAEYVRAYFGRLVAFAFEVAITSLHSPKVETFEEFYQQLLFFWLIYFISFEKILS